MIDNYRSGLSDRSSIRNDVSKYEAIALTLVNVGEGEFGRVHADYPASDSLLHFDQFLRTIYTQYDLRFVYQAPELASRTRRNGWDEASPALKNWRTEECQYQPRLWETDSEEGCGPANEPG